MRRNLANDDTITAAVAICRGKPTCQEELRQFNLNTQALITAALALENSTYCHENGRLKMDVGAVVSSLFSGYVDQRAITARMQAMGLYKLGLLRGGPYIVRRTLAPVLALRRAVYDDSQRWAGSDRQTIGNRLANVVKVKTGITLGQAHRANLADLLLPRLATRRI